MFYCDACGAAQGWPDTHPLGRSHGRCEVCGKVADCNDVPSSALPPPPVRVESTLGQPVRELLAEIAHTCVIRLSQADGGEPTTILIGDPLPRLPYGLPSGEYAKRAGKFFADEAKMLAIVLRRSLPGGTLNALLAELLQRQANLLRVPMPEAVDGD